MPTKSWKDSYKKMKEGLKPAPPGSYQALVEDAKATRSKDKGKPQWKLRFVLDGNGGDADGKKVWDQLTFSEGNVPAMRIFFRHMAALGLGEEFWDNDPDKDQIAAALEGQRATLELVIRNWGGEDRNEVNDIKPPEGGQTQISSTDELADLDTGPAPQSDDDVPF